MSSKVNKTYQRPDSYITYLGIKYTEANKGSSSSLTRHDCLFLPCRLWNSQPEISSIGGRSIFWLMFLTKYLYLCCVIQWPLQVYCAPSCQTPITGQTWELTLLSCGNKKKRNKNNNPHPNSPRRGCPRVLKFCMRPSVTKRISLHHQKKIWYPPITPHYDIFGGELYFSPRRGCPRVMKFCMRPLVTKIISLHH